MQLDIYAADVISSKHFKDKNAGRKTINIASLCVTIAKTQVRLC